MIEQMPGSHDNVLGFRVSGDVSREDYTVMQPAVQQAVDDSGSVRLLLDLRDFRWEKVDAWATDLHFGTTFRNSIDRMAIVGNRAWERWLTHLAKPFYARDAKYFDDADQAWEWLGA